MPTAGPHHTGGQAELGTQALWPLVLIVLPTKGANHLVSQEPAKWVRGPVAVGPCSVNSPGGFTVSFSMFILFW